MSGTLTPLWSDSGPPTTTSVSRRVVALARHPQAQLAVVQQQRAADRGRLDDLRMRQVDARGTAWRRVQIELESLAGLQLHAPAGEIADAQLRALHVGENADRPVEAVLELADHGEARGVILMRAVAEVEPEHVGAGLEQPRQHLRRGARGAEGGDDLRASAAAQSWVWWPPWFPQAIRMARTSLTLVSVGPVTDRIAERVEQRMAVMRRRASRARSRPKARARASVSGVDDRAGEVVHAVDAVGVACDRPDVRRAAQRDAQGQQEFGVATAVTGWPSPSVTVVSPPDSITAGGASGWPCVRML